MQNIGRYEVIEELGRGAMGVVYRCRDTQIGRLVALKMILTTNASPQEMERFKARFQREAQAAGRLTHPGIIAIHDIAEDQYGQPYIVQEFVEGRPLNLLLGPTAELPLDLLFDIGIQVAQALDYAHKNGVVHRDIKPPNILVTPDGRAKIADFGIARMEGTELTQEGTSLGTPSYMSPEQFRGGAIDGRSDIFSLGAVLYWMFTGQKPFPGDTVTITSFQVAFENPVLPSIAKTGLPKGLDEILNHCLAKNPENRYATCAELAADLDAVRHGKPLPERKAPRPDMTAPYPLPSRKPEPARVDSTVPVPVADPNAKTRAISTDQFASRNPSAAQPPPVPRQSRMFMAVLGGGAVVALLLGAGVWIFMRPAARQSEPASVATTVPPVAPAAAPQPAETAPATQSPASADSAPAQAAEETRPANEPATRSAAPRKRPKEPSAAAKPAAAPEPIAPAAAPVEEKPAPPVQPAAPPPVVESNLAVDCHFPFKEGTLEITVDGKSLLQQPLKEKKRGFTLNLTASREFEKKENPIAIGQHRIRVHMESKGGKEVWEDTLTATIEKNVASKLEITFKEGSDTDPGKHKIVLTLETIK